MKEFKLEAVRRLESPGDAGYDSREPGLRITRYTADKPGFGINRNSDAHLLIVEAAFDKACIAARGQSAVGPARARFQIDRFCTLPNYGTSGRGSGTNPSALGIRTLDKLAALITVSLSIILASARI